MAKRYEITAEQKEELERERKKNKKKRIEKRLRALVLRAEGKTYEEIGKISGYHPSYVSQLVSKYCRQGLSAIVDNQYKGNHRNLSVAQEEAVLEPFKKAAQDGQIVEVSAIRAAYEEKLGRSVESSHGQIYNVLQRHGWRKVMPRSKHPKRASEEEIEASKKLTVKSEN